MSDELNGQAPAEAGAQGQQPAGMPPTSLLGGEGEKPAEGVKPEWLDESLWDSEAKTYRTDDLAKWAQNEHKRAEGLRKKLSEAPHKAPDKAEDYKLPDIEDEAIKAIIPQDDAVMAQFKGLAKDAGISQGQYEKLMTGFFGLVAANGGAPAEPTEADIAEHRATEMAKLGPGGMKVANAVTEFVETQYKGGLFSENDKQMIGGICSTAEGLQLFNKIRSAMGGASIPANVQFEDGLPSDTEIKSIYAEAIKSGDPAKIQKAEQLFVLREKAGRGMYLNA